MPKLKDDPIQKSDLIEYLNTYSDFSFELAVLRMLKENDVSCEHGGLYEDPVTGKSREFDIRSNKIISNYIIRLAIECKNIKENFPVLVSCIPRHSEESYHQIAMVSEPKSEAPFDYRSIMRSRATTLSLIDNFSIYKENDPVGKSTAQVGRALNGEISANDGELYDKWSQSLSSLSDLVSRMYWDGDEEDNENIYFSAIFPIVVIPNGRLWQVIYDYDGNKIVEPSLTNHCSCFIGKTYEMGTKVAGTNLLISHIDIMTFDGLNDFVTKYMTTEEGIQLIFPKDGIPEAFERKKN